MGELANAVWTHLTDWRNWLTIGIGVAALHVYSAGGTWEYVALVLLAISLGMAEHLGGHAS